MRCIKKHMATAHAYDTNYPITQPINKHDAYTLPLEPKLGLVVTNHVREFYTFDYYYDYYYYYYYYYNSCDLCHYHLLERKEKVIMSQYLLNYNPRKCFSTNYYYYYY